MSEREDWLANTRDNVLAMVDEILRQDRKIAALEQQLNTFQITGSDGCSTCEAGRVTVFKKSEQCTGCIIEKRKP